MKQSILILFLALLAVQSQAQCTQSCCSKNSATAAFAALGSDVNFQNAHEAPLEINYAAMGRMITFPTPDGKTGGAYYIPAKKQTKNYLFVFQENWGLNDWIKKQSDLFADSLPNVNIIAIDLYDGKVAKTSDEAMKFMQACDQTRLQNIIKGAVQFTGENSKIATVGWCFGGGWSLQAALIAGSHTTGCVMFYGMPETDASKLKGLNSDVLFIWADKDQWINEQVKNDFVKNMNTAGKQLIVKQYDADHAFANPSNPHYDKQNGDDATKVAITYLRKHFPA